MMKYFDVCTKQTYKKNGEDKVVWLKCGSLSASDDGKKFLKLNHLPDVSFYIFEQKKKEAATEFEG